MAIFTDWVNRRRPHISANFTNAAAIKETQANRVRVDSAGFTECEVESQGQKEPRCQEENFQGL